MKKGFTIVELLVALGIIAILLGISTSAVVDSIRSAREKRSLALCAMVQEGLATYNAQKGFWPEPLAGRIKSGSFSATNEEGANNENDADMYVLTGEEVRQVVKALVDETKAGNPLMDISGLFVSREPGESGGKGYGLDFMSAVRGTKQSRKKMGTSEMYFGYPDRDTGRFRRFKIVYSIPTDHLMVSQQ